jgi:stage V sporulation protein B
MGITFIVFPMLARAHAQHDGSSVRRYTHTGLRIALIITGALVSVTSGLAPNLLRVVFPSSFAEIGGESMQLLCIGLGAFALFGMTTTVLNSLGRQWQSLGITVTALALVVGFNFVLVRPLPFGSGLLHMTATATSLGIAIGLILSVIEVRRAVGGIVALRSVFATLAAMLPCILLGRSLPELSRVTTVLAAVVVIAVYFALLAVLREVGMRDLVAIKAIFSRR